MRSVVKLECFLCHLLAHPVAEIWGPALPCDQGTLGAFLSLAINVLVSSFKSV